MDGFRGWGLKSLGVSLGTFIAGGYDYRKILHTQVNALEELDKASRSEMGKSEMGC